jgi:hypothetical protein
LAGPRLRFGLVSDAVCQSLPVWQGSLMNPPSRRSIVSAAKRAIRKVDPACRAGFPCLLATNHQPLTSILSPAKFESVFPKKNLRAASPHGKTTCRKPQPIDSTNSTAKKFVPLETKETTRPKTRIFLESATVHGAAKGTEVVFGKTPALARKRPPKTSSVPLASPSERLPKQKNAPPGILPGCD